MSDIISPTVFISYSWTSPQHAEWVLNLADDLINSGINVKLDQWDLKEGHDKFHFMEQMVNSKEINKVLIILDKGYKEKSDSKKAGVGIETQIMSPEIYNNISQEKFIPIIAENDDKGNPYLPTFIKSRIYIDLSDTIKYNSNWEKLIRTICDKPELVKPELGKLPHYIIEENTRHIKSHTILKSFRTQIDKNPNRIDTLSRDILSNILDDSKKYKIDFSSIRDEYKIGEEIAKNIIESKILLKLYVEFLEDLVKEVPKGFDIDIIIEFLQNIYQLRNLNEEQSRNEYETENFKIYSHLIFLITCYVFLKNKNYNYLDEILNSDYWLKEKYRPNEAKKYKEFYCHSLLLEHFIKKRDNKGYYSGIGHFFVHEVLNDITNIEVFIEADILCFYHSKYCSGYWFPLTYIYKKNLSEIEIIYKLKSKKHFERVKCIFNVETSESFKNKVSEIEV